MDADRFDALVQILTAPLGRRAALGGVLGLGAARAWFGNAGAAAKPGSKRCRGGTKRCGRRCIPKSACCRDAECGTNQRCTTGVCAPCLGQGADCDDDAQCCTGICDLYSGKCRQVRSTCSVGEACPGGRCCEEAQCVYVTATQGACVPNVSCGYVTCGNSCDDVQNCGDQGSAACHNGRCCCPRGIPLEDCPNVEAGSGFLPRCPKSRRRRRRRTQR